MHRSRSDFPWLPRAFPLLATAVGAVLLFFFSLSQAHAGFMHCRTDPIITLSNGDTVIILVDVDADPVQIQKINYVLHVPAGVTAVNITYTGTALGLDENLVLKDDSNDAYKSETTVDVGKWADVLVTMSLRDQTVVREGVGGKKLSATIDLE